MYDFLLWLEMCLAGIGIIACLMVGIVWASLRRDGSFVILGVLGSLVCAAFLGWGYDERAKARGFLNAEDWTAATKAGFSDLALWAKERGRLSAEKTEARRATEEGVPFAILKTETIGCKNYDDFIEIEALQIERAHEAGNPALTSIAAERRTARVKELRANANTILTKRCQPLKAGGVFSIESTHAISGPYEVKEQGSGITYYLPGYQAEKFEIK